MQNYKNVIHECILRESFETEVLDVIPPPELHLYEHIVTKIADIITTDKNVEQFFSQHTITRHGYNGGGYDGPNSKKILGLLDEMAKIIQVNFQPCILVLRKFKKVRLIN